MSDTITISKKQALAIGVMLAIGAVAGALILGSGKPAADHDDHGAPAATVDHGGQPHHEEAAPARGPHGGKLFVQDGYGLEVTIFEHNVEPQFRIYTYQDGKALAPGSSQVSVTLERLGRAPQTIAFAPEADYLKGDAVVGEPHSFKVALASRHGGKAYRFGYEQIEARVTMSELQVKQNGVDIHTAGPARIKTVLKLSGDIALDADRTVHVAPRMAGVVESVRANAGDQVRKGQVLAVISSLAVAEQRGAVQAARQRYELARTVHQREQTLWQEKISAEQDYLQAKNAMQEASIALQAARQKLAALGAGEGSGSGQLARYELRAPIDGVVTEKRIAAGEAVKEDASVFVVADMSTVWVEVNVGARELDAIAAGQVATVKSSSSDDSAAGKVVYISAMVGEQTRAAKARIVLPNPKGAWRPGAPVSVDVVAAEVTVPVAVSADAIQTVGDGPAVFGRYGDSFEARPLSLGRSDGQSVEVLGGLLAGEKYAARNSFLIKADLGKSGASHDH